MPGLDRTGPNGEGPRTGRGLGKCNPANRKDSDTRENDQQDFGGRGFRGGPGWSGGGGRGRGRGFGRGRGRGW